MNTAIAFDALSFSPMTWRQLRKRYEGAVRPVIVWDKIKSPPTGMRVLRAGDELKLVWYEGGTWRDGAPRTFTAPGSKPVLIRIPAVKVDGMLLAVDGCHRLVEMQPMFVIVDWFAPRTAERVYINDLFNPHLRRKP